MLCLGLKQKGQREKAMSVPFSHITLLLEAIHYYTPCQPHLDIIPSILVDWDESPQALCPDLGPQVNM